MTETEPEPEFEGVPGEDGASSATSSTRSVAEGQELGKYEKVLMELDRRLGVRARALGEPNPCHAVTFIGKLNGFSAVAGGRRNFDSN